MNTPTVTAKTLSGQPVSKNGSATAGPPPLARTPLPTRQRRGGWTALGAVLVIGLGLRSGTCTRRPGRRNRSWC